jgi:hypothetical protein
VSTVAIAIAGCATSDHSDSAIVGISDLFAAGTGFDFAGAILLGLGLLSRPGEFQRRIAAAQNSFAHRNVSYAENRADGLMGIFALCFGFGLQAIAYVDTIGGGASETRGFYAYVVAALFLIGSAALTAAVAWSTRWPRIRRTLVEIARYGTWGVRRDDPDGAELARYARVLDRPQLPDEDQDGYVKRVFKVDRLRDPTVLDELPPT